MRRLLIILFLFPLAASAQDFNIQSLTPSALLPTGTFEIKTFNNFYSQTHSFDADGSRVRIPGRNIFNDDGSVRATPDAIQESFLTSINQLTFGLSPNVNIGLDIWVNSGLIADENDTRFNILEFQQTANSRTALSYIGPRIKFTPVASVPNFSIQSTLLIPVANNLQGIDSPQPFINHDAYVWLNQFFLDKKIGAKTLLFFNADLMWGINRNSEVAERQSSRLAIPLRVFFNYFANDRLTLQIQNELTPVVQQFGPEGQRTSLNSHYWNAGVAAKYQLVRSKLEIEASGTQFLVGRNTGAGNTINLGLRFVLN